MKAIMSHEEQQPGVLRGLRDRDKATAFYNKIARVYDFLSEASEGPIRRFGLEKLTVKEGGTRSQDRFWNRHLFGRNGPDGRV